MSAKSHVLVVGGQRSGKSRFAEDLIVRSGHRPVYIATATAGDDEMTDRIAKHRSRRGDGWATVEVPLALPSTIVEEAVLGAAVLVDCLTLWLSNLIAGGKNIERETAALAEALAVSAGPVVLVSNEVGSGIIPDNPLARRYADALGILNQDVARAVDRVVLVAAGQPLLVKPSRYPEISL